VFSRQASQGQVPDLSGFQAVLSNIHKCVQEYLGKRNYRTVTQEDSAGDAGEVSTTAASPPGEIRSAQDALLAMEKICQYFERHEPSSPVPLLLRRAQRLVAKTFLEVIQDVCPDAISQIRLIGGVNDSDSDGGA
jgi:type VI secretion system protein ImpA